jgi:hypothetical protein
MGRGYRGDEPVESAGKPMLTTLKKSKKLNELKGFRISSCGKNGSPPGGLAQVNAAHIWRSAIESE